MNATYTAPVVCSDFNSEAQLSTLQSFERAPFTPHQCDSPPGGVIAYISSSSSASSPESCHSDSSNSSYQFSSSSPSASFSNRHNGQQVEAANFSQPQSHSTTKTRSPSTAKSGITSEYAY